MMIFSKQELLVYVDAAREAMKETMGAQPHMAPLTSEEKLVMNRMLGAFARIREIVVEYA